MPHAHSLPPAPSGVSRRSALRVAAGAVLAPSLLSPARLSAAPQPKKRFQFCAFVKGVQSLDYDELADRMAELGFDGIEATVRKNGHVLPERVEDDLPKLVAALAKRGLAVTVMASDVNSVEQPHTQKVLQTAAKLGIQRYRLKAYTYDLKQPVKRQLQQLRPTVQNLAALNQELGITGLYQNHSGSRYVGATLWDLDRLFQNIPATQLAIAFDIRHATVEGGLSWPVYFNLVQERLGAIYVKDFRWNGRKAYNVPLGAGKVDPHFARLLLASNFSGPISVHVEYLLKEGVPKNMAALAADLKTLQGWLAG